MLVKTGSADIGAEGTVGPGAPTPAHPKRERVTKIMDTAFTRPTIFSGNVSSRKLFLITNCQAKSTPPHSVRCTRKTTLHVRCRGFGHGLGNCYCKGLHLGGTWPRTKSISSTRQSHRPRIRARERTGRGCHRASGAPDALNNMGHTSRLREIKHRDVEGCRRASGKWRTVQRKSLL